MLVPHLWPQKGNCEFTLNYVMLCVMFWVPFTFKIWIEILFGSHSLSLKDNIEMYFEEVGLGYVDCISLALIGDQRWTVQKTLIKHNILRKCVKLPASCSFRISES
jgi:hypothetical protein